MPSELALIEMRGVTKRFGDLLANDDISLSLFKGEILALLGENGAGKSTLMSILFGLLRPDSGEIFVKGQVVTIPSPIKARALGIGMVHQHFKLVPNMTVGENIILGNEPSKFGFIRKKFAYTEVERVSKSYGLSIDPKALIENISVGQQQRVEILKMLYQNAEILIFDEPTAVLTPQEIIELMGIIKNLKAAGKSIILITHKLREIMACADRCVVIRKGRVVGRFDVASTTEAELAETMVGRPVEFKIQKNPLKQGESILAIDDLWALNDRNLEALKGVSFEVHRGEILGVAGIEGNGQTELAEIITGLRRFQKGRVVLKGKGFGFGHVRERYEAGMSHVPEDRQKRGLILDFKLYENLAIHRINKPPILKRFGIDIEQMKQNAQTLIDKFDVRASLGGETRTADLSGGNQQKAILARELELDPDVLVAVQPTRGLDVGSIEAIHKRLLTARDAQKAVLLFSLELDEILNLSDRIIVLFEGLVVGSVNRDETDESGLGLLMAGGKTQ